MCGGTILDALTQRCPVVEGLSPRVAGEPSDCDGWPDRRLARVYPRVCGGTRVNRSCLVYAQPTLGSIPACAGEPWPWTFGVFA